MSIMKIKNSILGAFFYGILILSFTVALIFFHFNTTVVVIQSSGFDPSDVNIYPGTVTWINNDTRTHRVVSDYGWFDSGNLTPGQSYNYTFRGVGAYPYHCSMDTSLKGTIRVEMLIGGE
jgi:plastocyanin